MEKLIDYEKYFTEAELNMPVTFRDLCVWINGITPSIVEEQDKLIQMYFDGTRKIIDMMADTIQDLKYEQMRDRIFFMNTISHFNHVSKDVLSETYTRWCEEYDKLNKPKEAEHETKS